jgi:hypothetical protein
MGKCSRSDGRLAFTYAPCHLKGLHAVVMRCSFSKAQTMLFSVKQLKILNMRFFLHDQIPVRLFLFLFPFLLSIS